MRKKQKLVPVTVYMEPNAAGETIVPATGESITELLADWRVMQIQPLGTEEQRRTGSYAALLLLEEDHIGSSSSRLGFDL